MTEFSDDFAALWAQARAEYDTKDFPRYGSEAWRDLPPDSPKRLASALEAAEMWRRYGDPVELMEWLTAASAPRPAVHTVRSYVELTEARNGKPPHQIAATAGWPAVAIPGQPGKYLTHSEARRAA